MQMIDFWWESPDGSRVFAYRPMIVDGESLPPREAINQRLIASQRRYGVKDDLNLIGVGNHGGGAIRADVERMRALMAQRSTDPKPATIKFSTPARFVEAVLREPHDFPVVRTELPPTIRGSYTSVGEIKKGNRQSENLLLTAEKFSVIAARLGVRPYPQAFLFEAWKKVMLNQFHDTISGTEVQPAVEDALQRCREVQGSVGPELEAALSAIAARIQTEGRGVPVVVLKKAEDSDDLLLRCYESTGSSCSARVTLGQLLKIDAVHTTDLLEQSQAECPSQSTGFQGRLGHGLSKHSNSSGIPNEPNIADSDASRHHSTHLCRRQACIPGVVRSRPTGYRRLLHRHRGKCQPCRPPGSS
jgi:alpha-mannosidase